MTLPPEYVREHVELGYATTVHRAQGLTVDHAHVLAAPGMTREALYVAMTRGRLGNHLYVSTDAIDPDCDGLPDPGRSTDAVQVLRGILATAAAEQSAIQTLRSRQDEAGSLATLVPIRATLLADADMRRWRRVLPSCSLTPDQAETVLASPAAGALLAALREGERRGYAMDRVLGHLVTLRPLESGDDAAEDIAAVLHARVTAWLEARDPDTGPGMSRPQRDRGTCALDPDDPVAQTLTDIDSLIRARVEFLTAKAGQSRPAWLRPLGEQLDGDSGGTWRRNLATLAAYRDTYRITGTAPLGHDPSRDATDRRERRRAARAAQAMRSLTDDRRSPSR